MILLSRMCKIYTRKHVRARVSNWDLKIQVARDMQLRCPHSASNRNWTGIFANSRTKGDSIHWPAKYFASIAVKREKNPGAATFHRRLNSCLQIAQSHSDIFTARKRPCVSESLQSLSHAD